jgi:hypothetical protein
VIKSEPAVHWCSCGWVSSQRCRCFHRCRFNVNTSLMSILPSITILLGTDTFTRSTQNSSQKTSTTLQYEISVDVYHSAKLVELGSDVSGLHLNQKNIYSQQRRSWVEHVWWGKYRVLEGCNQELNWEGVGGVMFGGATEVSPRWLTMGVVIRLPNSKITSGVASFMIQLVLEFDKVCCGSRAIAA